MKKTSFIIAKFNFYQLLKYNIKIQKYLMFPGLCQQIDEETFKREKNQRQRNQKKASQKRFKKHQLLFSKNRKQYYWNDFQQRRYVNFVIESIKILQLPPKERKFIKVNIMMSRKIKTRNPAQCHTHHQKMLKKYKEIKGLIQNNLYLYNDYQVMVIKEKLKQFYGQTKTMDQILMYSQKSCLGPNEILTLDSIKQSQLVNQLIPNQLIPLSQSMTSMMILANEEKISLLSQKELEWIEW